MDYDRIAAEQLARLAAHLAAARISQAAYDREAQAWAQWPANERKRATLLRS